MINSKAECAQIRESICYEEFCNMSLPIEKSQFTCALVVDEARITEEHYNKLAEEGRNRGNVGPSSTIVETNLLHSA